jgi:uncharacterized membrane protein (UPF0127 family)
MSKLDAGSGLWIYPCEAVHTFGMKMPIDILFLDREHRVRKIVERMVPGRFACCLPARSVIELPAGAAQASGTQLRDRMQLLELNVGAS